MPSKKISELTAGTAVSTSVVPASNAAGTETTKLTLASILALETRWSLFAPPAPTSLTAVAGNTQASLSWTAPTVLSVTPITDYVVQYSSNSGSTWTTFSDGTSTATSATVTGLTNGTAYVFRVAAVNGVGTGAYTAASSSVTPSASVSVDYLVVAGGGGGGVVAGGGGGGGGALAGSALTLNQNVQYVVSVGAGGSGANDNNRYGSQYSGSNSAIASLVTAFGGGGGAGNYGGSASGGSGGGGCQGNSGDSHRSGASGTSGQGNAGADGGSSAGGGGGGAATAGQAGGANGGDGGSGLLWNGATYAGGGGGGSYGNPAGAGGAGGGGAGLSSTTTPNNGVQSTGGGGGGISHLSFPNYMSGSNGGSGVVIIRTIATAASTTGSPTVTQSNGYNVYTFTGTGSITF
jgi:hypothetical protein